MRLTLKRIHLKSATLALCTGIVVTALAPESGAVKASPKPVAKKAASAAAKTVVNKPITRSASAPAPGRTTVPVPGTSSGGPNIAVKMRPANSRKLATSLPAKKTAAPAAKEVATGSDSVSAFARTIRFGWNAPTPSLGTTFGLAVDGEYILTTADAIANAWVNSGDVKFYLDDTQQPVTLIGFDLDKNVAVFSAGVNARVQKSLTRQRFRFVALDAGENFVALTASGVSTSAKRVSGRNDLGSTRERFELSNADLRSTAFLFDRFGRWVASVSPSDKKDGRLFDVTTAAQVQDVLRVLESRPPAAVSRTALQMQAFTWQEKWTTGFLAAAQQGRGLASLACEAEPMKVENEKFAAQLNRTRLVRCANALPVAVSNDYAMGIELVTGEINFNEDVKSVVTNDTSERGLFAQSFFGPKREIASINLLTVSECEKTDVTNSKQRKLHVRFCTSAMKNAQGLTDTTITVISADTGSRAQVSSLHLKGFDVKNSKKFMEWMIESEAIR